MFGKLGDIAVLPFELKSRAEGDDAQAVHFGQSVDELFGEAVTEVFVLGIGAQVGEGEDGDGGECAGSGRGGVGDPGSELGQVASFGQDDAQLVAAAFRFVVRLELGAEAARLDADDGVGTGIERRGPVKDLGANRVLFDLVRAAGKRLLDDEPQEAAHALGGREDRAAEDTVKLLADGFRGDARRERALFARPAFG
jgi:hypothetical protein